MDRQAALEHMLNTEDRKVVPCKIPQLEKSVLGVLVT